MARQKAAKPLKIRSKMQMPSVNMRSPKKVGREKAITAFQQGKEDGMNELKLQTTFALFTSLRSEKWFWPNITARENGTIVDSPRNIVDTSRLMFSQSVTTQNMKTKSQLKISYSVPYAAIVHYGGVIRPYGNRFANSVVYPARPWVQAILEGTYGQKKLPIKKILEESIRNAISAA